MIRFIRLLFLLMAVSALTPPAFAGEAFSFVQLCDPQLGHNDYEQDKTHFRQAVEQINALRPDLVIICGDLVNDAKDENAWKDFLAIESALKMPCYCVPGNHDIGNECSPELRAAFQKRFGKDYQSIELHGYTFVLTNTQLWKQNTPGLSGEQDRWLAATLQAAAAKNSPVFIAGHIPPFTETPGEEEHYFDLPPEPRMKLLAWAKQYGVKAFLMGHVHRNCLADCEGISLVASASTCKNNGAPLGFRLWKITADGVITHAYIPLAALTSG